MKHGKSKKTVNQGPVNRGATVPGLCSNANLIPFTVPLYIGALVFAISLEAQ